MEAIPFSIRYTNSLTIFKYRDDWGTEPLLSKTTKGTFAIAKPVMFSDLVEALYG